MDEKSLTYPSQQIFDNETALEVLTTDVAGSDIKISPMGFGSWQIGDRIFWDFGKTHQYRDSYDAFVVNVYRGINFIDTAEVYGFGRSEKILGELLENVEAPLVIATKFFPYPWRLSKKSVISALEGSLRRLGLEQIDLYLIHWPFLSFRMQIWAEGLAEIVSLGLSRAVGVSNFNRLQMKRMYSLLQDKDIPLATNQVEYNLLNREIEKNGLMDFCHELGVKIIAYSPLAQGLLTGKYNRYNPPTGIRKLRYRSLNLDRLETLMDVLEEIGKHYGGRSHSQVAINWLMCKGVIPIPGAKTKQQALDNVGALGWRLDDRDVIKLEAASERVYS